MTNGSSEIPRLERLLAGLLHHGTWLVSTVIALGIALALAERYAGMQSQFGLGVVTAGIALFILLPVLRVVLMLVIFVHERDYRFVAIAGLVLVIILLGFLVGVYMPSLVQGPH